MVQLKVPMTIEDDMIARIAKTMSEEIDWKIIADMLVESGWVMVNLDRFINNNQAVDIETWIGDNCKGKFKKRTTTFVFEKKDDAAWFKLRWL